jgi:hypothetical protein
VSFTYKKIRTDVGCSGSGSGNASGTTYTPAVPGDYSPVPNNVADALDQLAARPIGSYEVEKVTLDATDITNKQITLAQAPDVAAETRLIVIGGVEQEYGVDFTVSSTTLSWNAQGLDGVLEDGDRIIVVYS